MCKGEPRTVRSSRYIVLERKSMPIVACTKGVVGVQVNRGVTVTAGQSVRQ